ncbi:early nodulin-like protein 1 [Andrographis paniculata]|uniref:early nodulin-like protein 1 n=1 Tax=Andrographis paniculata TaxID=175694 RepID=UPI0021E7152A|nr:early nodulin-like protein 1 [Andrographis paniculata]
MAVVSSTRSAVLLLLVLIFLSLAEGRNHLIEWKIPSSESESLNQWASRTRFRVGDTLEWRYDASKDSVLQVSKRDYVTCTTSSPLITYNDGNNTTARLEQSGPHYYISGAVGHCQMGQKLIVVVMSEHHRRTGGASPAPAPSPADRSEAGPSIAEAPASGAWSFPGCRKFLTLESALVLCLLQLVM